MTQPRHTVLYLLGVLVLLAGVVLTTPGTATRAAWRTAEQVAVPASTTGRAGLEVAADGDRAAVLTNTSGFGVLARPADVSVLAPDGTVLALAGASFAWQDGCAGPAAWTARGAGSPVTAVAGEPAPLPRDATARLCLEVSLAEVPAETLRPWDGRSLRVLTRLEALSLDGVSQRAERTWETAVPVDLPAAQPPAGQEPPGEDPGGQEPGGQEPGGQEPAEPPAEEPATPAGCTAAGKDALVTWTWQGPDEVLGWELLRRPQAAGGTWETLRTLGDGSVRQALLTVDDIPAAERGPGRQSPWEFTVRPRTAAGPAADPPALWTLHSPGNSHKIACPGDTA